MFYMSYYKNEKKKGKIRQMVLAITSHPSETSVYNLKCFPTWCEKAVLVLSPTPGVCVLEHLLWDRAVLHTALCFSPNRPPFHYAPFRGYALWFIFPFKVDLVHFNQMLTILKIRSREWEDKLQTGRKYLQKMTVIQNIQKILKIQQ